jgi:hypothetical protein
MPKATHSQPRVPFANAYKHSAHASNQPGVSKLSIAMGAFRDFHARLEASGLTADELANRLTRPAMGRGGA